MTEPPCRASPPQNPAHRRDPDQEKVDRVIRAMMTMTKFDIAGLDRAYADA